MTIEVWGRLTIIGKLKVKRNKKDKLILNENCKAVFYTAAAEAILKYTQRVAWEYVYVEVDVKREGFWPDSTTTKTIQSLFRESGLKNYNSLFQGTAMRGEMDI